MAMSSEWSTLYEKAIKGTPFTDESMDLLHELLSDVQDYMNQQQCSIKQNSVTDEKILLGLTILANILQNTMVDEKYAEQFGGEKFKVHWNKLAGSIMSCDRRLDKVPCYIACKCVALMMPLADIKVVKLTLTDSFHGSGDFSTCKPVLDILLLLFSYSKLWPRHSSKQLIFEESIQGVLIVALEVLEQEWSHIMSECCSADTERVIQHSFFKLWVKVVKNINNGLRIPVGDESDDSDTDDDENGRKPQIFFTATHSLIPLLQSSSLTIINYKNILNILNHCLPYCTLALKKEEMDELHYELALKVIELISKSHLLSVPKRKSPTGFGGENFMNNDTVVGVGDWSNEPQSKDSTTTDGVVLRKMVLLSLKSAAIIMKGIVKTGVTNQLSLVCSSLINTWLWVKEQGTGSESSAAKQHGHWAIRVFCDQDDSLVEAMLCLLDIYTLASLKNMSLSPSEVWTVINPHEVFISFLDNLCYDHKVLLDLLTSPETSFLMYFIKYFHFAVNKWKDLCKACENLQHSKDSTVSVAPAEVEEEMELSSPADMFLDQAASMVGEMEGWSVDLKAGLTDVLRDVSAQRAMLTQSSVMKDVSQSLHSLRTKRNDMDHLLKQAYSVLGEGDEGVEAEPMDIHQTSAIIPGNKTKMDNKNINVTTQKSSTHDPSSETPSTAWPQLTGYSDSESDDDEISTHVRNDVDHITQNTKLLTDCSHYLSKPTDCAVLMQVIGEVDTAVKSKISKLTQYSDSEGESDGEDIETENILRVRHLMAKSGALQQSSSASTDKVQIRMPTIDETKTDEMFKEPFPKKLPVLEDTMTCLIRLRFAVERLVEKGLFPYSASPLIKLITQCENLYEN